MAEPVVATLVGAMAGSFANVAIHRLPRRESLILPRSHCPHCGRPIRARDNIPLLSFVLLRGRCRDCGGPISWRYPLVEALTAVLFLAVWARYGATLGAVRGALFVLLLVVVLFIDLDHRIIPDRLTYPGLAVALLLLVPSGPMAVVAALGAAVGAGAVFLAIALASRGGMGGGDVKLAAVMGAFLGWPSVAVALFTGSVVGGVVAVVLLAARRRGRKDALPFGPFLAVGGLVALFFGQAIVEWYGGV